MAWPQHEHHIFPLTPYFNTLFLFPTLSSNRSNCIPLFANQYLLWYLCNRHCVINTRSGKVNCIPWLNDFVFLGLMRKKFIIWLLRQHYVCQHLKSPSAGGDIYGLYYIDILSQGACGAAFIPSTNATVFDVLHLYVLQVYLCLFGFSFIQVLVNV